MIRISELKISDVGPIKALDLKFNPSFNIICGPNGIGKTTILDCLAQSFSINQTNLRRRAGSEKGAWDIEIEINGQAQSRHFETKGFHPNENVHLSINGHGFYQQSNEIVVFRTHRDIPYQQLGALSVDPQKNESQFAQETLSGSFPGDLKNWFVNRHLWSRHSGHLDRQQLKNIALAKRCFSILNPRIKFSKVVPRSNEILLNTPDGEIYFEYLSSGYKSCMAVLIGLIKEVEFRFRDPSKYVKDFNGIVFIDEVDLHLHPEWQAAIYLALKKILPKAQVFTSTHSPHLIQVAEPDEVMPLVPRGDGIVEQNPIPNSTFGCQGWSVEEVLTNVMGMSEARTTNYLSTIRRFSDALDAENANQAKSEFEILDKMLHPENSLRKIMRIQLSGL